MFSVAKTKRNESSRYGYCFKEGEGKLICCAGGWSRWFNLSCVEI